MRILCAFESPLSSRLAATLRRAALAALVATVAACGGSADAPPPTEGGAAVPAQTAPAITTQPSDASVVAPATTAFVAAASGTPAPSVQWQQSTNAGATWTDFAGVTNASFTTPATTLADSGKLYRAVFTNAAGSAVSNSAQLTVTSTSTSSGLSLLAGDIGGVGNIDGTGTAARLAKPVGLAVDSLGNVYAVDVDFHTIRKITRAGVVTTFAGRAGVSGNADGTGSTARFFSPSSVAVDGADNVFVADFDNDTIRKITPAGVVTTFAGSAGLEGSADGVGAAARFRGPSGVAADAAGNVFVADQSNNTIRKITAAGVVTTIAGTAGDSVVDVDGPGPSASFVVPISIAVDTAGTVYVGEGGYAVRKITPAGVVTTLAGLQGTLGFNDGIGAAARFNYPRGLALDGAGNVYVADTNNGLIRKITPAGVVSTLAGTPGGIGSLDGTVATATFTQPAGIAVDAAGKVYVGEESGNAIRTITPAGVVSTIAGAIARTGLVDATGASARFHFGGDFRTIASTTVDHAGNVYVTDYVNGALRKITPAGAVTQICLSSLAHEDGTGIVIDPAGNLVVSGHRSILLLSPTCVEKLLAGEEDQGSRDGPGSFALFGDIAGLAIDTAGNVYVGDQFNNNIRKLTPAGDVTTLAGTARVTGHADGFGPAASFSSPMGVAVDEGGNVFVADSGNNTIRKITPAGVVSTFAGTAGVTGSADGIGAAASFNAPSSLALDSAGNLYVAELANFTVRKITPAGVVTTVLGVAGQRGVRLGADGRVAAVTGLSLVSDDRLVLVSADAVLTFDLQ